MKTTDEIKQQLKNHNESDIRSSVQKGDGLIYNATQDKFYILNDETIHTLNVDDYNPVFSDSQIFGLTQHRLIFDEIIAQSITGRLVLLPKIKQ